MAWTAADIPDLTGKVFVVTGGNSGIGYESAVAFARHGGRVVIACRNPAKAADALARIREVAPKSEVEAMSLDLASLASVRDFARQLYERFKKLDVLLNNAGVMAIPRAVTADGFEMQLGTNHLGHFALTDAVLDLLIASGAGRVVNVASSAHRWGWMNFDDLMREKRYWKWLVYGQSKLANLLFTAELDKRLRAAGAPVLSAAAHPGYAATNLQFAGPRLVRSTFQERIFRLGNNLVAQDAARGAWPQLYAATMPDVRGNDYFGPDGFRELWGHPTRVGRTRRARSEADAATLWQRSVELTSARYSLLG